MKIKELIHQFMQDGLVLINKDDTTPNIALNKGLVTLCLSEEASQEKIFFYAGMDREKMEAFTATRLIYRNGDKFLTYRTHSKDHSSFICNTLIANGGVVDFTFSEFGISTDRENNGAVFGNPNNYNPSISNTYQILRDGVARVVLEQIHSHHELLSKAEENGIRIISIGCGFGDDLLRCYSSLSPQFQVEGIGIDLYKTNIIKAQKKHKGLPFLFTHLDAQEIDGMNMKKESDKLIVVLACGFLTRETIDGPYPCAQILQKIKSDVHADLVVVTGHTQVMISQEMANSVGYHLNFEYLPEVRRNIVFMTQKSELNQQHFIESRSKERSRTQLLTLDLSLTDCPLKWCSLFAAHATIATISQIDLSWSHLKAEEIIILLSLLPNFRSLKNIIFSFNEPWSDAFYNEIVALNQYNVIQRSDCINANELPTLPVQHARLLKIYDALPCKSKFKPCQTEINDDVVPTALHSK